MRRTTSATALAGLLLLLGYVLPLYVAPGAVPATFVTPDTDLMARLYPGVPAGWILLRFACLVAGAALLLCAGNHPRLDHPFDDAGEHADDASLAEPDDSLELRVLLGAGALLCATSPFAGSFSRIVQIAYLLGLLLIPLVVAIVARRRRRTIHVAIRDRMSYALPWVIAACWMALRLYDARGSVRIADAVDYLSAYKCFELTAADTFSILSDGCWTGYTSGPLLFQGHGILGWHGLPLSLWVIQIVSAFWAAAMAALLGSLVASFSGIVPGAFTTAALLWSPIVLLRLLIPGGSTHTTIVVLLMACGLSLLRQPRAAAAAGFGALAGLGSLLPSSIVHMPMLAILALPVLKRRRMWLLAAALFFAAAFVPGAARLPQMFATARTQATSSIAWAPLDAFFQGRTAPSLAERSGISGRPATLDVAAGLVLSPVGVARAPTRLWGDVIFEPICAALSFVGLLAALAAWRRSRYARFLLLSLASATLPAIVSSYDRVMPTRVEIAVPVVMLAAYGLSLVLARMQIGSRSLPVAATIAGVVAVSGTWIFDFVNARILWPSAAGLAMRAGDELGRPVLWSNGIVAGSKETADVLDAQLLGGAIRWWDPRAKELPALDANDAGLLWTPGDQMERQISARVCAQGSGLALYEIVDGTGQTRLFAALRGQVPNGVQMSDSSLRWLERSCDTPLPTDATVASRALEQAWTLANAGQRQQAIEVLRAAATSTLVQPRLYYPLASLLAQTGEAGARSESRFWARIGCHMTEGSDPSVCALAREADITAR